MTINFPSNPSLDQIYTFDNRSWRWNGEYWQSITVTVGYTGSRGQASIFKNSVPTEQDLPIPYGGDEGDGFLVESTGFMWIWDGSSWGSLGQFRGFTGSQGVPGSSVRIIGSVQAVEDLPVSADVGDGYLVLDTGDLYLWNGSSWSNIGKIAGDTGPIGYTGSRGSGIIDTEIVDDDLIITYDDSSKKNLGNVRGFQGSRGESSFTWGPTPPLNPEIGARWFDTTAGILLVYVTDGVTTAWLETAASGFMGQTGYTGSGGGVPKIANVVVLDGLFNDTDDLAVSTAGGAIKLVGTGFEPGCSVLIGETVIDSGDITFVNSSTVRVNVPSLSTGSYTVYLVNTDGGTGIRINGLRYSQSPSWITAANLGEQDLDFAISIQLSATSDSAVTYSLASGSELPPGLTLGTNGLLSGTVTDLEENTEYTFTVVATDQELQDLSRTFSVTITAQVIPSPQLFLNFDRTTTLDPRITFTRATNATYFNSAGVLTTAGSGVPRFNHRLEGGVWVNKGLLIEEARTNSFQRSEEFNDAFWTKENSTITANAVVAPDGTTTADKLQENTANSEHRFYRDTTGTTNTNAYTLSVFAKAAERSQIYVAFVEGTVFQRQVNGIFNLSNGTFFGGVGGGVSSGSVLRTMENCGNGWYRCTVTAVLGGTQTSIFSVISTVNNNQVTFAGTSGSGLHVWGAQLEAGAFPTSYIKTVASTATRNADVATMTGTNFTSWYNASEGTLFAQYDQLAVAPNGRVAVISDNTNSNVLQIYSADSGSFGGSFQVQNNGVIQANVPGTTLPIADTTIKVAGVYKANDFAGSRDGGEVVVDTAGTIPTVNRLNLGVNGATTGTFLNGHIAKFYYWNRRLLDRNLKHISAASRYENDADLLLDFDETTSLDSRITFTRATNATFFNASGVLATAGSGVARFDHRLEGGVWVNKGLLIEEARTNLALRAEEFSDVSWTKTNSSVSADVVIAPDGTTTADKLIENTTNTEHYILRTSTIVGSTNYTSSVFVKTAERTRVRIVVMSTGGGGGAFADADLTAGTITAAQAFSGGTATASSITNVGNGWYRISVSGIPTNTGGEYRIEILNSSGQRTYAGTTNWGLYVWGAQLEAGAFPTSYIKTTNASATRNADVATMTSTNFSSWFNASEGTIFSQGDTARPSTDTTATSNRFYDIRDGTPGGEAERFLNILATNGGITGAFLVIDNSVIQASIPSPDPNVPVVANKIYKTASAYKLNDFAHTLDGNVVGVDTTGTLPTVNTAFLGSSAGDLGFLNGHIAKFYYWRQRLPNQRLQDMTGE